MKSHLPRFALLFLAALLAPCLHADDTQLIAVVRAADDERVAAMTAADPQRLDAIYSDQLIYTHSNGKHDTKASYIESLVSHHTIYESHTYGQRDFLPIAPGVVLMTGRVTLNVNNGGQKSVIDIGFLSVWREEKGKWRFVAWQSSKLPAPAAPTPTAPAAPKETNVKVSAM